MIENILFWAGTSLILVTFIVLGFLLKSAFISFRNELQELKQVMSAILNFISAQKEKNENIIKEVGDLWNKVDEIETKQDKFSEILNKIKVLHFRNHNEQI
jgi:septation ring formation regulator EzrA